MRIRYALPLLLLTTPAFAQFPPPGIYACTDGTGRELGTLSLLVAGDYQWDTPDGQSAMGQMTSAANRVEAISGVLGEQHWAGRFVTERGETTFAFETDGGPIACGRPKA